MNNAEHRRIGCLAVSTKSSTRRSKDGIPPRSHVRREGYDESHALCEGTHASEYSHQAVERHRSEEGSVIPRWCIELQALLST